MVAGVTFAVELSVALVHPLPTLTTNREECLDLLERSLIKIPCQRLSGFNDRDRGLAFHDPQFMQCRALEIDVQGAQTALNGIHKCFEIGRHAIREHYHDIICCEARRARSSCHEYLSVVRSRTKTNLDDRVVKPVVRNLFADALLGRLIRDTFSASQNQTASGLERIRTVLLP